MLSKENQSASFAFCENNTTQYTWGRSACEDCCFAIDQLTARCPSPWWHTADLSKLDNDLFRCCPKKTCKWKFRSPHPSLRCWLPKETEIRLRDSAEDTTCLTMEFGNVDQAAIMWRETKPWTIGRFEAAVAVYYPSEMRTPIWNLLSLLYSSMTWNDGRYISPEDVLRQTFQGPPPKLLFHSTETTVGMVVCCRLVVAFTTEAAASCPWALAKQKSLESHDKQVLSWPGMKMLWLSTKHHLIYFRPPVSLLIHSNKFVAS